MNRVNSLDFSANKKLRKPFHYELERGFSRPLSARCFADIFEKKKQDEFIRVSGIDRRQQSPFLLIILKQKIFKPIVFKKVKT